MRKILIVTLFQVLLGLLAAADVADAQLRHILERATRYEDNPHASWGDIRFAIQESGGDSNRVVSLMKQLIEEGTQRNVSTGFYLLEIGKYGTSADLPFLYQRVGTTNFCEVATESVLKIEGLTTNSLEQIKRLMPCGRGCEWETLCAWSLLLEAARKQPLDSSIRSLTVSNAVFYAARHTEYPKSLDKSIKLTDPSYTMSKRRLAVLRSIRDIGVNEWHTNYVMQAINELVAYPEADLPE